MPSSYRRLAAQALAILCIHSLVACAPAPTPGADSSADTGVDAAGGGSKPTCTLIGERCHDLDGVNMTATMCHRVAEAPTSTEATCAALREQCLMACPEGDGGHSHGADAAADSGHSAGHDH